MELAWPHRRCILCSRSLSPDVPFARAHLIPAAIGGFVWAWTKCKECNDESGSSIEAAVVSDDSIVFSVNALREQLPDLARKFDERTRWIADTAHGKVEARLKDGDFELLTTRDSDCGRRQGTVEARAALLTRLKQEGHAEPEVAAALALFDAAEVGKPLEMHGQTFVQGQTSSDFRLPLDGPQVSDAFPSLIAFHFLALALGQAVFDSRLDYLRASIRQGQDRSEWHVAESGITREYAPAHLLGFAQCHPHIVIRVQLFGWNVWRVHFPRIASSSEPIGLRLDLTDSTLALATPRLSAQLAVPNGD